MTATISLVAGSQPDRLTAAAVQMQASIVALEAQISAQQQALARLAGGWQGSGADAAQARARANLEKQEALRLRLQGMQSALNSGGSQLSAVRSQILSLAAQATSLGGLVSDEGAVLATGIGRFMTPALAAAYTALLKALLKAFDAVDQATAAALDNAGLPQAPPKEPAGPQIPPEGTDAEAVKRWWDALSDEDKQRVVREHPEQIGNLKRRAGGVPQ